MMEPNEKDPKKEQHIPTPVNPKPDKGSKSDTKQRGSNQPNPAGNKDNKPEEQNAG